MITPLEFHERYCQIRRIQVLYNQTISSKKVELLISYGWELIDTDSNNVFPSGLFHKEIDGKIFVACVDVALQFEHTQALKQKELIDFLQDTF